MPHKQQVLTKLWIPESMDINIDPTHMFHDNIDILESLFVTVFDRLKYNVVKTDKDINGIYTVVEHHRIDNTLMMKSTVSGISPKYDTRHEIYYGVNGIDIVSDNTYTITYDSDGIVTSGADALVIMEHGINSGGGGGTLTPVYGHFIVPEGGMSQYTIPDANFNQYTDVLDIVVGNVPLTKDNYTMAEGSNVINFTFTLDAGKSVWYRFIKSGRPVLNGADGSTILVNSIGEAQMKPSMKKQAGGVASFDTVAELQGIVATNQTNNNTKFSNVDKTLAGARLYMYKNIGGAL